MCICNIKPKFRLFSEVIIDKDKLLNNFIDIKTTTNLYVIKCYKLLFNKEVFKYNIGSYIILFIIFIYVILLGIFIFKGYKLIIKKINNSIIIYQKKYLSKDDSQNKITINKKTNKNAPPKTNNKNKSIFNISSSKSCSKRKIIKKNNIKNYKDINKKKEKEKEKEKNKKQKNKDINIFKIKNNTNENKKDNIDKKYMNYNDYELNSLKYKYALKYDKRTYFQYYISLIRTKHPLMFAFFPK
jgi:hypothetical protein